MRYRWLIAALLLAAIALIAVGISRVQAPSPPPVETASPPEDTGACIWQWARQDAPEAAARARAALDAAGLTAAQIERVEAYGENCLDAAGGVRYFAAMTTDFYLTAAIARADDDAAVTDLARAAFTALTALPADALPARAGYFDLVIRSDGQERRLRARFEALSRAQTDAEFLAVLQGS